MDFSIQARITWFVHGLRIRWFYYALLTRVPLLPHMKRLLSVALRPQAATLSCNPPCSILVISSVRHQVYSTDTEDEFQLVDSLDVGNRALLVSAYDTI